MAKFLRVSINAGLRSSIFGKTNGALALVFKNLQTEGGDQIITQSGDTLGGNV